MSTLSRLADFANELATMDDKAFAAYADDDFARKINHAIRDERLARTLAHVKDRRLLLQAVEKKMNETPNAKHPFQHAAKEFLIGFALGALAMLMVTRAVL